MMRVSGIRISIQQGQVETGNHFFVILLLFPSSRLNQAQGRASRGELFLIHKLSGHLKHLIGVIHDFLHPLQGFAEVFQGGAKSVKSGDQFGQTG